MRPLKLTHLPLLMAGVSLALAACTIANPNSAFAETASQRCAASARMTGGVPESAPSVNPSLPADSLRLTRFYTLTGNCAREAHAFEMDHILFADGRIMAVGENGSLSPVIDRPLIVESSVRSPSQAPRLGDASLTFAARVHAREDVEGRGMGSYVGVWPAGGKWVVASFRIAADGQASTPQPLLESELPIRGVGYFPAPDTPSGQLGVVQQVSADTARLLNYQWYHPGL